MLGTGASQLVSFAALPLVARIYGPKLYGEFSAYLVWVGLAIILATLQLQHALILPKLRKHAFSVFLASASAILLVSLLVLILSFAALGLWIGRPDALALACLMALATGLGGISQVAQGYAIRIAAYSTVAKSAIVRVLVVATLQCLFGWYGFGAKALLLGYLVGDAIGLLVMAFAMRDHVARLAGTKRHATHLIVAFRRYHDFARYGVAQEFMNSLSQGLPVLLLGHGYGQSAAGAYAAAARLLGAPVQLIGNATRQVVYREFAQAEGSLPEQLRLYKIVTLGLIVPAALVAGIAYPWMDDLTVLVLGNEWELAGAYSPPMALWFALAMGNSPATAVFRIVRRQDLSLYYNMGLLLLRGLVLWVAILYADSVRAVYLYAIVGVFMNLVYVGLGYRVFAAQQKR